jgi:acetyltransferase-like isoleucine patch superfamily enzyme
MKKLNKLEKDPTGKVIWTISELSINLSMVISSVYCYILAFLWHIKIESGCRFYGVTNFKRYPCSEIFIGNHCGFRSSFRSNFVGLNRACGISTHSKSARIRIGKNCGFSGSSIAAYNSISIGDHVLIGANTIITDFDWHPISKFSNEMQSSPIIIENDVWVGMNCTILKGIQIGKGTIIGANSVVTQSMPPMVIAAGSPAKVIRDII